MGFIPDIERIVGMLPKLRQTLFFSATMPPEIRKLADKFLMNPKEVSVSPPATVATTVRQGLAIVQSDSKREALRRLIAREDVQNAIIFCNRKRDVDILFKSLKSHGFDVGALHGDMVQSVRTETLERFKNNEIRLLVASDVAARGLDVDNLSHVFNFDVPTHPEDYVHRIGRTGRAGKSGAAFTLASPDEGRLVAAIEQLAAAPIERIVIDDLTGDFSSDEDGGRRGRGRGRAPARGRGPKPQPKAQAKPARSENAEPQAVPATAQTEAREDNVVPIKPARAPRTREERRPDDQRQEGHRQEGPRHEERRARQDRPQEDRPRDERSRDERSRDERSRDERPRDDRRREEGHRDSSDDRRRDRNRERDLGPPVVGMGDHMPAFLMRPARGR